MEHAQTGAPRESHKRRRLTRAVVAAGAAGLALGAGVTIAAAVTYPPPSPSPSPTTTTSTTSTTVASTTPTTTAPPPPQASGTTPAAVDVMTKFDAAHGTLLADSQSMSLYTLTNNGAAVACSGQCAQFWPPFEAPAGAAVNPPPGVSGVATVPAADGNQQITFRGLPVYRYVGDKTPADANGEGIVSFGGTWHLAVVTPVARLTAAAVADVPTPDGKGYWLAAANGGVFAFGDAGFFGSLGGTHLAAPVAGMAATPDGRGYWLVGSDGGVFAFGDAGFFGSLGGTHLASPIRSIVATPDGKGYWLLGGDGGVFTYGDAGFFGSGA